MAAYDDVTQESCDIYRSSSLDEGLQDEFNERSLFVNSNAGDGEDSANIDEETDVVVDSHELLKIFRPEKIC